MTMDVVSTKTASEAAAEVAEVGSTVLRQVWPIEKLRVIRAAIAQYTAIRLERVKGGSLMPSERMYAAHGVGTFPSLVNHGLITPDALRDLFAGSFYQELCCAYFESDELYAMPNRLGFRNHNPLISQKSFIPYHQDSYTQDVRTPQVLNCWIPLDPGAGSSSPGLEVVRHRCRPDFPRKDFGIRSENAAYDFITIDRDEIVREFGDNFLAPEFSLGDGLVFSEDVIHRTYVTPAMTDSRINFELRVFSSNSLAPGVTIDELAATSLRLT